MSDHQSTQRVSEQSAQGYLGTHEGELFRHKLTEADPAATQAVIEKRALAYLMSLPELPKYEIRVINPRRLKASAEWLEWVLQQYPNEPVVQALYRGLLPLIEDAKAGRVTQPVDRRDIPGGRDSSEGVFEPFMEPDVEDAYVNFVTEVVGGLTETGKMIIERIASYQKAARED